MAASRYGSQSSASSISVVPEVTIRRPRLVASGSMQYLVRVAADLLGDVEDALDDLIRQAALPRDGLVRPVEQRPRMPRVQLDEQIITIGKIAVDIGSRQPNLGRNVVHRGLTESVASALFSSGQDALADIVCACGRGLLTARTSRHMIILFDTSVGE